VFLQFSFSSLSPYTYTLSVCAFETYREKNNGKEEKEEEERVKTLLFSLCRADRRDVRLSSLSLSRSSKNADFVFLLENTKKKKYTKGQDKHITHVISLSLSLSLDKKHRFIVHRVSCVVMSSEKKKKTKNDGNGNGERGRGEAKKRKEEEEEEEEEETFYDILGVRKTEQLSEKTLERAYKKSALKYHPDRPSGDAEKFLKCTKAFETLKDANLRSIYDKYGEKGLEPGFVPPQEQQPFSFGGGGGGGGGGSFGGFQDQQRWAEQQRQQRQERYARRKFGFDAGGGQAKPGFGMDEAMRMFKEHFGDMDFGSEFGSANKRGRRDANGAPLSPDSSEGDRVFEFRCSLEELYHGCTKQLLVPATVGVQEERVDVDVKPGWKSGTKLTYFGRGAPAKDGKRGNLVLICKQEPHDIFRRSEKGNDLEFDVRLPVSRALCGFRATVKFLDGKKFEFDTREVSTPGKTYVVKGKGMPDQHNPTIIGDCVIRVTEVIFPKSLADNQRAELKRAFNGIDIEGL